MQTSIPGLGDGAPPHPALSERGRSIPVYSVKLVRERRQNYDPGIGLHIVSPKDAANVARAMLEDESRESLLVLLLDSKNTVRGIHVASTGLLDQSLVHPREVFQAAILANSAAIILAHNHPSGDPHPSAEDRNITVRIGEAGKILGIDVLDHVIIGHDGRYVSLKERGAF